MATFAILLYGSTLLNLVFSFVFVSDGLSETAQSALSSKGKKSKGKGQGDAATNQEPPADAIKVTLHFKRYMYDPQKRMIQR